MEGVDFEMSNTNSLRSARTFYVTRIAMLTAVASLLMIIELPIPIFPSFYKLDFSYFPVVIATFSMGPVAGTVTAVLKNLIAFLAAGVFTESAGVGALADMLIGLSFIIPAGLIYRKKHSKKGAVIALGVSLVSSAVISCALNYWLLIPVYASLFGLDGVLAAAQEACSFVTDVKGIIVFGTLPFNLTKWIIISLLTLFTYKPLSGSLLKKPNTRQKREASDSGHRVS